ncbi:hypothetical protein GH714_022159 [Hevea brasiliensis]|uniref:CCHC-type domain-containing protein n=1 Tax=Hevea brasiliensis TaxID=3981 RepID=A0A6A6N3Y2_HEVBR|nr:hypothetical protein GH714_022159 [Hevea brasiliensis]
MSDDKTLTKIPHFDGHYDHWSELMENLLRAKGLWSLIENGFEEPKGEMLTEAQQTQLEDARTKDHQVKHYLFQAIDRTVFEQILDRRTAKIVWDSMKKKFGGNSKVKKSLLNALRREFEVLEMKREESIDEYFARVMTVANKMRSNGEEMTDTKIVEKILRTLTGKFTYVCVSIEESKDTETMTVDELQSTLVVHEQKFKRVRKDDEDQVLKIEGRSSASRGRGSGRGRGRGRGRAVFNKATVECYKCHDLGHFQYECPKSNKEANYAELEEEDELLLMAYVELHETNRSDAWFVDSGCSNHMCGNQEMFSSLDTSFTHSVKLGNNARMKVTGKGEVKLSLKGVCYTVSDVYCVPELRNNLLSVGQLQEKGVAVLFKDGVCSLYHPLKGKMAESVMSANRMFILLGESPAAENEKCLQVGDDEELLAEFKCSMEKEFDMTDLGLMKFFLGIEIIQKDDGIFICQRKYAGEVLQRFGMENHNPVSNPIVPGQQISRDEGGEKTDATQFKQMVGSLMYLTATRPDLMFVASGKDGLPCGSTSFSCFSRDATSNTKGEVDEYNGSFTQLDDHVIFKQMDLICGWGRWAKCWSTSIFSSPGYLPHPVFYGSEAMPCYSWDSAYFSDVSNGNTGSQNGKYGSASTFAKSSGFNSMKSNDNTAGKSSKSTNTQAIRPLNKVSALGSDFSAGLSKGYHPVGNLPPFSIQKHGPFPHNCPMNYRQNGRIWNGNDRNKSGDRFYKNSDFETSNELTSGPRGSNKFPSLETAVKEDLGITVQRDQYNKPDFETKYADAKFYVIKSYNEDDIHKSIKYDVWASTPNGNKKLDAAFVKQNRDLENNGRRPVTYSRDTQEVSPLL